MFILMRKVNIISFYINVLNCINIDGEIPVIAEKSAEEVKKGIHCIFNNFPIPILLEKCDGA